MKDAVSYKLHCICIAQMGYGWELSHILGTWQSYVINHIPKPLSRAKTNIDKYDFPPRRSTDLSHMIYYDCYQFCDKY